MDAKDMDDRKQTRGLRRPFGAAGKTVYHTLINGLIYNLKLVIFNLAVLM